MKIGIGLPTTIRGVKGGEVLDWARRADAAGFSCLGTIDRLVYPNYEPFIGLTAAAAVTERISLTTAVALLPPAATPRSWRSRLRPSTTSRAAGWFSGSRWAGVPTTSR